jgi:hypothetical protein
MISRPRLGSRIQTRIIIYGSDSFWNWVQAVSTIFARL